MQDFDDLGKDDSNNLESHAKDSHFVTINKVEPQYIGRYTVYLPPPVKMKDAKVYLSAQKLREDSDIITVRKWVITQNFEYVGWNVFLMEKNFPGIFLSEEDVFNVKIERRIEYRALWKTQAINDTSLIKYTPYCFSYEEAVAYVRNKDVVDFKVEVYDNAPVGWVHYNPL